MFDRDSFDVHSEVHVSFTQAVLGGEVRTTGLSGPIVVKVRSCLGRYGYVLVPQIPAGIASHHKIRLANRGIPRLNSHGNGDHYVHVKIKTPRSVFPFCYTCSDSCMYHAES